MLGTEVVVVTTALVTFVTTVAASCCGAYLCSRNDNNTIELLKEKKRVLGDLIDALKQSDSGFAVVTPLPTTLITRVDDFFEGWDEAIIKLEEDIDAKCMNGLLPNLWVQKQARVSMEKKFPKLNRLIEEALSMSRKPVKGYKQSSGGVTNIAGRMRIQTRDEIWNTVLAETGTTICIHGSFGVGKTVIARYIHDRALEVPSLFKHVAWVNLDYGSSLSQIQEGIAKSLGIVLSKNPIRAGDIVEITDGYDTVERARMLKNALLQKGKFLLVLDSMWHSLSFEQIGIPELVNGQKVIVTSRLSTVCSKIRGKKMFEIEPLPTVEESWELFEKELGFLPEQLDEEVITNTMKVVEEFDGLPMAINKLAQILGYIIEQNPVDLSRAWRKELSSLNMKTRDSELFDKFKESYKNLREETRRCFLYCAVFPKEHLIDSKVFIECLMWEGLLGDFETLEEGREKVMEVITELKNAHLLESGIGENVKMLNLIRSMAIDTMAETGNRAFVRSGSSLSSLPLEYEWPADLEKASFMQNQITALRLRNRPKFNRLSTLLMQDNPINLDHDEYFFNSMPNLRFLDMSRTNISALPTSLAYLTSLTVLLLCNCVNLRELPDLSKIGELVVLDLSGTPLEVFPRGIEYMRKLRRLNLSGSKFALVPAKAFDQLIQLEELLMITDGNRGYVWGSSQLEKQKKRICVEELWGLRKLTVLHLHLLNVEVLEKYMSVVETETGVPPPEFRFRIGNTEGYVEKNMVFINGLDSSSPEMIVRNLLKLNRVNVLDVHNINHLSYLFSFEIWGYLRNLKEIRVRSCHNLIEIVQQPAVESTIVVPELSKIVLCDLPRLKSFCNGEVLNCPNLRFIEVWKCEKMKLPMIKCEAGEGMEIQVRGERSWLHSLKWDNRSGNLNPDFSGTPHSSSKIKFQRISGPPELIGV